MEIKNKNKKVMLANNQINSITELLHLLEI